MELLKSDLIKIIYLNLLLCGLFFGCGAEEKRQTNLHDKQVAADSNLLVLEFNVDISRAVYERTNFGEPPQLSIWIENQDSSCIKTVWVSRRTGRNDWKGKVDCAVALPYWTGRHKFEQSEFRERNIVERIIDAVTGATPTGGIFTVTTLVPKTTRWYYFIEVNVSGDYNIHFPYWSKDGIPDDEVNGQPSIVYKGEIRAIPGSHSRPSFYGRSEQRTDTDELIENQEGLTTALQLLDSVWVNVR